MLSIKTYNIEKCRQLTKSTLIPSISLAMRRNSRNKNITYQCCLMKTKTWPISSNVNSIACSVIHQRTEIESATFDSPPLPSPHVEEMIEFSKEDIMEAIDDIKPSAAAGPDEIPVSLLKNCKNLLAEPIHLIWSNSLSTSKVPDCYKTSLIALFIKKEADPLHQTTDLSPLRLILSKYMSGSSGSK